MQNKPPGENSDPKGAGIRPALKWVLVAALLPAAGLLCWQAGFNPLTTISAYLRQDIPAALFIVLMTLLPVFGFPIVVFLVLAGVKFGFWLGVLVTAATMPVHLILSYLLANSVLRPQLEAFCRRRNYRVPRIPADRMLGYSLAFLVLPGLSYTMKNYLFSLSGIPFRYYLGLGWSVQGIMGVPLILFGEQPLQVKLYLAAGFFLLFLLSLALALRLKKGRAAAEAGMEPTQP